MNTIINFFSGRKTYIIAIIAIVYGLSIGDNKIVLDALLAITIRLGIAKR